MNASNTGETKNTDEFILLKLVSRIFIFYFEIKEFDFFNFYDGKTFSKAIYSLEFCETLFRSSAFCHF